MRPHDLTHALKNNPKVPTLSPVAARILALAANENTSAGQIADVIGSDPGLASKILGISNSSFYGNGGRTTRVSDAVRVLGMRTVRNAVLGVSVFDLMGRRTGTPSCALSMWERSLNVAAMARMLAQRTGLDSEEAFLFGLLSDVGVLAMANLFPAEYGECVPRAGWTVAQVLERERIVFGISHPEAGRVLASEWKLPKGFCDAIAGHHDEVTEGQREIDLPSILNLSANLIHSLRDGRRLESLTLARHIATARLSIERKDLDEMLVQLPERVAEIVSQFDLNIETPVSYIDALLNANEQLAEMNQRYEAVNRMLEEANEKLSKVASSDGLTGIANRRSFDEALVRECARAARYGHKLVLAMGDVDHFKSCNDRYGHLSGDDVLRAVAAILADSLRSCDLASRYGGEEFAILLPETDPEAARGVLERLRLEVQNRVFPSEYGPFSVTISFGMAAFSPATDVRTPSLLVQRADAMLYKAKENGRNRVFGQDDPDQTVSTLRDAA